MPSAATIISPDNPFTVGLVALIAPGLHGKTSLLPTVATGTVSSPANIGYAAMGSAPYCDAGVGVSLAASTADSLAFAASTVAFQNHSDATFVVFASTLSIATRTDTFTIGPNSATPYEQRTLSLNSNQSAGAAAGVFSAFDYSGGFLCSAQSIAGMVDGNPHVYAARRSGSNYTVWRDGVNVTSSATSGASTVGSGLPNTYVFGASARGAANLRVSIGLALSRALSDAEMAAVTRNPWIVF